MMCIEDHFDLKMFLRISGALRQSFINTPNKILELQKNPQSLPDPNLCQGPIHLHLKIRN